ncbi:hypothetical protein KEM48_004490 [Puccinia striiformis f. sp. tritici PST-130]|nr:hypothetical protein KEM48_004490 [Puccinia striiformis f. sp. tritici PST-130]
MSRSISRVSALIKHHRSATGKTASILNKSSRRNGSSHAANHVHYGPEYEAHEGMGNSLFVATGAGIVGLALYHAYVPSSAEDEESILTRQKTEAHNMAVVFDASDKAFFKASVERPTIRRLANAGNFGIASPYGVVPGTSTDFSDLVIKSPRDDLRRPEDVKLSHPKSN